MHIHPNTWRWNPVIMRSLDIHVGGFAQVLVPGAYRSVCIELELHHLAVNSIVQVIDDSTSPFASLAQQQTHGLRPFESAHTAAMADRHVP